MRGAVQMQITTIGLDIAKNVFQVHGIDAKEKVVARKQLRRSQVITFFKALPPCLIGMEACATAWRVSSERSKSGSRFSIARARRASGLRPSRGSELSGRLRSWRRWQTRLSSGRDAISRPGSDWCLVS